MKEEAVINVEFLSSDLGGRSKPIDAKRYGCPIIVGDTALDCRFLLAERTLFLPGIRHNISVAFLNPNLARQVLCEGTRIQLWEGRVIADGTVKSIGR